MDTLQLIAQELSLGLNQVQNALALFAEGGTDFAVHEVPRTPAETFQSEHKGACSGEEIRIGSRPGGQIQ